MRRWFAIFAVAWLLFAQPRSASAEPPTGSQFLQADTISRLVDQVEPSVVSILRIRQPPEDRSADSLVPQPNPSPLENRELLPNDYGAGVLVKSPDDEQLFVLTAYHVVRNPATAQGASDSGELQLRFHNRRSCSAEIFAADPRSDLAVLSFDPKEVGGDPADLKPLDWKSSAPVRKGEIVVCLGNPYALARDGSASVSWGIVSNLARRPMFTPRPDGTPRNAAEEQSLAGLGTVMQLDTRLQLGGSGGPVVNLQGRLVGVSTALAAIEGYEKSAGFAVPVAPPVRRIVETLLRGQEVEYGLLGVTPGNFPANLMRSFHLYDLQPSAVEVLNVPDGSPAKDRIQKNDILLKINDQPLLTTADLMRVVGELPPETEVTVQLYRPGRFGQGDRGEMLTCRSKLGKWPVKDVEGIIASRPKYPAWRGLRVDYPSAREKIVRYEAQFLPGVIVVDVAPDSSAARAQLKFGDVITEVQGAPVQTPGEFHRAVEKLRGDVRLRLYVDRPGGQASATLHE